ncbi:MAG: hypothetical protein JXR76_22025 [Deltaproteobacteria bacterium]|nr:hypothetical protein [Deltaproteobacteria bacterium]
MQNVFISDVFRIEPAICAGATRGADFTSNDDRIIIDEAAGLIGVGRAKGSGYGGYHKPRNIDAGIGRIIETCRSDMANINLRSVVEHVDQTLPVKQVDIMDSSEHATWTLTAGLLKGMSFHIAHIGVCRLLRFRNSKYTQITRDHSCAHADPEPSLFAATESQYLGYSRDPVHIDELAIEMTSGDSFIFCSPGVWANVSVAQMEACVKQHSNDPRRICEHLVHRDTSNDSFNFDSTAVCLIVG